jgi:hypothetical protein
MRRTPATTTYDGGRDEEVGEQTQLAVISRARFCVVRISELVIGANLL